MKLLAPIKNDEDIVNKKYIDTAADQLQSQVNNKADKEHNHDDRYYTESEVDSKVSGINKTISDHTSDTSNPHSVTKSQVGLGNVENKSSATIRGEITKSNITTALGYTPLNQSLKGSANGLAELDSNGKVPSSQLPSFVDDVVEGYLSGGKFYKESAHTTEISGETGKIYIDLSTEKTYRWSGSAFVVISETLALGETSSTAYRGDRGKIAYDHSQSTHARIDATKVEASSTNGNIKINGTETTVYKHPSGTNPHGTTKSDVGLGNVGNFKAVSTVANQGLTDTEKTNARANIGAGTSSFSGSYNDLTNKPTIPTVGNGTITIKQAGTSKGTFTMNQSGNTIIELTDNNTWRGIQDNLTSTSTTDSLSANQGKLLANGSARDNTKLPLAGGTMTGTINQKNLTLNDGFHNRLVISAYCESDDGTTNNGCEISIGSGGNIFMGGGESNVSLRTALQSGTLTGESYSKTAEYLYLSADSNLYLYSNCQTIDNRLGIVYDAKGALRPLVNNTRTLGNAKIQWSQIYSTAFNINNTSAINSYFTSKQTYTDSNNKNVNHQISFGISSSGNRGLYDSGCAKWLIYANTSNKVTVNGDIVTGAISAESSSWTGTKGYTFNYATGRNRALILAWMEYSSSTYTGFNFITISSSTTTSTPTTLIQPPSTTGLYYNVRNGNISIEGGAGGASYKCTVLWFTV